MSYFSQRPSARALRLTRSHAVLRLRQKLDRDAFPRLQMMLIIALTGAVGFLFSYCLLRLGFDSMALRYPLALAGAYGFFLLTLWLWLRTTADQYEDVVSELAEWQPGFSGGQECTPRTLDHGEGLDASAIGESDELAIPLLVVAFVVGAVMASLYVVYLAPLLFAELLFDGVLAFTLYRHLRLTDRQHWLHTALKRTALPFAITAIFLALIGAGMANWAPGARTLGEVMQHQSNR